jgi:GGDEF domain-containing protein
MIAWAISKAINFDDLRRGRCTVRFAAILPQMDESDMEKSIERVRRHLAEINLEQHMYQVRMSIGGATAKKNDSLIETLKSTDQALYRDKAQNRSKG